MRWVLVIAIGFALAAQPARADFESDKRDCVRGTGRVQGNACSRLLRSGRFGSRERSIIYNNRGLAYGILKQYRRAILDYNEAIRLNPRYAYAYNNRGNAYFGLKQYRRAIQDFSGSLRINPKFALAYYNRGFAYRNLKQYHRAIWDYSEAIRLNPKDANAYLNRGIANPRLKQYGRAIQDSRR